MNRLEHAGCGGSITSTNGRIICGRCHLRIVDQLELTPHSGWTPEVADRRRVYPMSDVDEAIGNAGALA